MFNLSIFSLNFYSVNNVKLSLFAFTFFYCCIICYFNFKCASKVDYSLFYGLDKILTISKGYYNDLFYIILFHYISYLIT